MGSASRLRGGNQAKKAQRFKVSVLGSHAGPGSAKTDSFLCSSFLGPPPTSSFSGVVAGTGIGLSSGFPETEDHEMDGAFAGRPPRCDPKCGQRVGAVLPVAEMEVPMVPVACALSADEGGASRTLVSTMFTSCTMNCLLLVLGGRRRLRLLDR